METDLSPVCDLKKAERGLQREAEKKKVCVCVRGKNTKCKTLTAQCVVNVLLKVECFLSLLYVFKHSMSVCMCGADSWRSSWEVALLWLLIRDDQTWKQWFSWNPHTNKQQGWWDNYHKRTHKYSLQRREKNVELAKSLDWPRGKSRAQNKKKFGDFKRQTSKLNAFRVLLMLLGWFYFKLIKANKLKVYYICKNAINMFSFIIN